MNVWLVCLGEPLIIDKNTPRLLRMSILADVLTKNGHSVLYWCSTFNHHQKEQRFDIDMYVKLSDQYSINLLKGIPYTKNFSFKRYYSNLKFAFRFFKKAKQMPEKPDIILCSLPTLELCVAATKLGNCWNIPVILDARDMWPDVFEEFLPKYIRYLKGVIFYPFRLQLRWACRKATALSGISDPYVDWEISNSNRTRNEMDKSFPHGYEEKFLSKNDYNLQLIRWSEKGIVSNKGTFIICMFSAFGLHALELDIVFKAAEYFIAKGMAVQFVLCGDGPTLNNYKLKSQHLSNVIYPGWVNSNEIWSLMKMSSMGIVPYKNLDNYILNIPNKPIEYMSAGLPIICSVKGLIKQLIDKYHIGVLYDNDNVNSLIEQIENLYNNPEELMKMRKNAYLLFKEKFDSNIVYQDMTDYLVEVKKSFCNGF